MRPVLALTLALMLLTLSHSLSAPALAQEDAETATPTADCRIAPRTEEEIAALAATPAPEPPPDEPALTTLPDGEPADAETIAAITETLREVTACAAAGDLGRLLALLSDDFIVQSVLAPEEIPIIFGTPTATPVTGPVATPSATTGPVIHEARLLSDGRVAAVVASADANEIIVFVRAGERWLIDEMHRAPATEPATPAPTNGGANDLPAAVRPALSDAAAQLGVPVEDITIVSLDPIEWSDSSLGCPQPDQFYAQVITPGYRLRVAAGDQELEYHTDLDGRFVLCAE